MKDKTDPEIKKWEKIKRKMIENSLKCYREGKERENYITTESDIINVIESKFDMMKHLILTSGANNVRIEVFMHGPRLLISARELD